MKRTCSCTQERWLPFVYGARRVGGVALTKADKYDHSSALLFRRIFDGGRKKAARDTTVPSTERRIVAQQVRTSGNDDLSIIVLRFHH